VTYWYYLPVQSKFIFLARNHVFVPESDINFKLTFNSVRIFLESDFLALFWRVTIVFLDGNGEWPFYWVNHCLHLVLCMEPPGHRLRLFS
jgi:hypothetical protein